VTTSTQTRQPDIALVSKMLGHSSVSVTADIYSHLIGSAALDASERAASLVPCNPAAVGQKSDR